MSEVGRIPGRFICLILTGGLRAILCPLDCQSRLKLTLQNWVGHWRMGIANGLSVHPIREPQTTVSAHQQNFIGVQEIVR